MSSNVPIQEIFSVVVTENEYIRSGETHLIIGTKKRIIYANSALTAYTADNAKVQAVLIAGTIKGDDAIKDPAEVEVKVTRPFRE